MRDINLRYLRETYNDEGLLEHLGFEVPEDFNFAYDIVDDIAAHEPDRRALVWANPEGEEQTFTFGDMAYWSNKTANYLAGQGIGRGDMVLVIVRRHYQFWFIATALHKLGAVLVPATFMLQEHDLRYRAQSCQAKALICSSVGTICDVAEAVEDQCPTLQMKIMVEATPLHPGSTAAAPLAERQAAARAAGYGSALSGAQGRCALRISEERRARGWLDFNAGVQEASADFLPQRGKLTDPFIMYFSSGTSGNPKMVLHDGGYAIGHTQTAKFWHNVVSDGGLHFTIADTGWGKAVWGKYYGQWIMEASVFTYDFDRFDADEILDAIGRYHITTLCCPPTMYRLLVAAGLENYDLSSLVYCTTAGEALNPDLFETWAASTGLKIFEGFGQTETPLTVANLTGSSPQPGSMGKASPQYELAILDEDGNECPRGQTGEICLRLIKDATPSGGWRPPTGIMVGYYQNPAKTSEAFCDGWYHTGDTAWKDEDDYLWYVGRNDDIIKSSGYRIGPFEVESVLITHDAVRECAVTPVPDEVRGFAVKATIVLNEGFEGSDELLRELQTWVKTQTAPYKYPRIIAFVDALPKTVNGKIRRAAIRQADGEAARAARKA